MDCSHNSSCSGAPPAGHSMLSTLLLSVVLAAIIGLTVCGNVVVFLAVGVSRKLRSVTNCFIVSLAVTDLLLGLLVLPFSAVQELNGDWPFGATFCNIYISLDVMLCTASILNLFIISLDRYFAVTAPLRYSALVTPGRVAAVITLIWAVSLMVSFLPIHLGWNTPDFSVQNKGRGDPQDECRFELNRGYVLVDAFGTFYLPLAVMCATYYRIFKIAREQAKRINIATSCCAAAASSSSPLAAHGPPPAIREHKATVTLAAVLGAFIVCWFPYFTLFTIMGLREGSVPKTAYTIVLWLGYVNSAINPILYAALNRDFRNAYGRLLRCRRVAPAPAVSHPPHGQADPLWGNLQGHSPGCKEGLTEESGLMLQERNGNAIASRDSSGSLP
ncbi:histamine H2 receptor-like [Lepisosteus oculatus]|uniref:histamine H2 receptor-like n=1 Tax=Lepisosteus oculatus TaxID=7918 RepID=UPI0035F51ABF